MTTLATNGDITIPAGQARRKASMMNLPLRRRSRSCLRTANGHGMIGSVNDIDSPLVLVSATRLDDLLELARMASERLPSDDPLTSAMRGTIAQVRQSALFEP